MTKEFRNLRIWCAVGFLLSFYASYVEIKAELEPNYRALCDVSEKISCTKAFSSRFGKGFGITGLVLGDDSKLNPPNGVIGIFFYTLLFLMSSSKNYSVCVVELVLCALANVLSVYLSFLLYFVLDDLCIVCVSIYLVNFFLFLEYWKNYKGNKGKRLDGVNKTQSINLNKTD